MVRLLVKNNACLEIFDNRNRTPYCIASKQGHLEIKHFLQGEMTNAGVSREMQHHLALGELDEEVADPIVDPLSLI